MGRRDTSAGWALVPRNFRALRGQSRGRLLRLDGESHPGGSSPGGSPPGIRSECKKPSRRYGLGLDAKVFKIHCAWQTLHYSAHKRFSRLV